MSMAFAPQFSYSPPGSAPLPSPQLVLTGKTPHNPETGRTLLHDACTAQGVCTCPVGSGSSVPYLTRVANIAESVYSQAAMTPASMGVEPSAFYPLSAAGQGLGVDRQAVELWKGLQQQAPIMYPFDPMLAVHPYSSYYGNLDLNNAARRKNATRETTSALKAWLYEHRKNPYPTKGEKIMLAIITKMTLTQVSTWFANARRRLKKESKLNWNSKDKDFDDSDIDCDELNEKSMDDSTDSIDKSRINSSSSVMSRDLEDEEDIKVTSDLSDISDAEDETQHRKLCSRLAPEPEKEKQSPNQRNENLSTSASASTTQSDSRSTSNQASSKPKIWSIAEIMNHNSSKEKFVSGAPLLHVGPVPTSAYLKADTITHHNGLLLKTGTLVHPSRPQMIRTFADAPLNLAVIDKKVTTTTQTSNQNISPKSC